MECCKDVTKRKKRKTRKCLDEIRKRSRCTSRALFDVPENKSGELSSMNIQHCIITDKRLTLRMFPNAIRSKTITRPALLHLSRDPQGQATVTSPRRYFTDGHEYLEAERHNISVNFENSEGNKSFDMFSSIDEVSDKSGERGTTRRGARALYEDLMGEEPACLQRNTKFIREDVMKGTKALLRDLYLQSCRDPSPLHQPETAPMRASSSASDSGAASPASSPIALVMRDTPEYSYYPHKLN